MNFRYLALISLLFISTVMAQGRRPAVEDFVGIEMEQPEISTPQGTESLYNLEKDMKDLKAAKIEAPSTPEDSSGNMKLVITFGFILTMPLMIWFIVMNHLKKKASIESASNIEVLEKYRKERETRKAEQDRIRKAS